MIEPIDVIIDTDIGSDVDDAYALLFALMSPELNVKGITLVHADLDMRTKITFKLLKLMGRTDVPVALGESKTLNCERATYWGGHEGKGIDFSDVSDLQPLKEHAVDFIARTASEKPGQLVLITIGPMTNAGLLIRKHPDEAARLKAIVSMASVFNGFGEENAAREHNVYCDPEAVEIVLNSGIPTLLVGLNVTLQTWLTEDHLEKIREAGTPLAGVLDVMTEDWFRIRDSRKTAMHDPLAVAAAFDNDVVESVPVKAEVSLDNPGFVTYEKDDDSPVRICTSVDADRFHEVFLARVLEAVMSK